MTATIDTRDCKPYRTGWTRLLALCCLMLGAGCETCTWATDQNPPERQAQWFVTDEDHVRHGQGQRARQVVADRYRGRIQPGLGCDVCPNYCALVDLRAIEASAFQDEFRQVVIDMRSRDVMVHDMAIIEHNRLTCMLEIHESMSDVMVPLLDAREHRRVRYEAALLAIGFGLHAGDPKRTLYELAQGEDKVARLARALIFVWDRDGWPEESDPEE